MHVDYARCEGAELFTADGRRIVDFLSGYCVHNVGHNHPRVVAAIKEELDRHGPAMLQSHAPGAAGELAARLCAKAGGRLTKAFFASSGSEGIETVIKFARAHTERSGLLHADGGFHGLTCGALSLMSNPFWAAGFGPLLPRHCGRPLRGSRRARRATQDQTVRGLRGGTGAGGERNPRARSPLSRDRPGALSRGRNPLRPRRGPDGPAPDWPLSRRPPLRARPGHGGAREGPEWRPRAERRRAVLGRDLRLRLQLAQPGLRPHLDLQRERARHARGSGYPRRARGRGPRHARDPRGRVSASPPRSAACRATRWLRRCAASECCRASHSEPPRSLRLRVSFEALAKVHPGLFGQMLVMRLFRQEDMLTQICGNDFGVLKVAPPLVVGEAQVDEFVDAVEQVVEDMHTSVVFWADALAMVRRTDQDLRTKQTARLDSGLTLVECGGAAGSGARKSAGCGVEPTEDSNGGSGGLPETWPAAFTDPSGGQSRGRRPRRTPTSGSSAGSSGDRRQGSAARAGRRSGSPPSPGRSRSADSPGCRACDACRPAGSQPPESPAAGSRAGGESRRPPPRRRRSRC